MTAEELTKLVAYLRRQGGQCNRQQPIVPVAGSELLKAADELERKGRLASCDTHPKGGDVEQAPFMSGAVPKADAHNTSEQP